MNKKIYIKENTIPLLEWGNSSISKNEIENANSIRYEISEPDEEDYNPEDYESYEEYYNDNVTYDFNFYNIDNDIIGYLYNISQWELDDYFDDYEIIQNIIKKKGRKISDNEYLLEDLVNTSIDINNQFEVNNMAKRLFYCHNDYYKGLGGYILIDGTLVDFGDYKDHNSISTIDGMTVGKFMDLGNIRIRRNNIDLVQEPTYEQEDVLRRLINSYSDDEIYIDICEYREGDNYASPVTSASYSQPDYHMVLGEINRYFSEGIKLSGGHDIYESKKINENFDLEVAPQEIRLDSFKKENRLNPKIWDNENTINSRVRLKLLDIADDFYKSLDIKWTKPIDIILTGSICNYNWSQFSDIDLHIVVDFSEISDKQDLVKEYFDSKKNEWNNEHENLNMFGLKVELYVQDVSENGVSNGIYSLEKNKWIKKPNENNVEDIKEPKENIIKIISSSIMTKIDDLENDFYTINDSHKLEIVLDKCDDLLSDIRDLRKKSLGDNGEFSIGNIVYKVLRRLEYLDKIWNLKIKIYDKLNSIY